MRRTRIVLAAGLSMVLFSGELSARRPERIDAFADSPAVKGLVAEAAASTFVLPGSITQAEPRLGVPTFVWAAPRPSLLGARNPEDAARRYLADFAPLYRLGADDAAAASIASVHDTGRGVVIVEFREQVEGIEVFRESLKVAMRRDLTLVSLSGYVSGAPARAGRDLVGSYRLDSRQAVDAAYKEMTGNALGEAILKDAEQRPGPYERFDFGAGRARAKRVLFHLPERFVPAYYVELDLADVASADGALNSFVVSASDGAILFRNDLTAADAFSYRVWAENGAPFRPFDGPQGNGASPHPSGVPNGFQPPNLLPALVTLQNGPISTNDPWLPPGSTTTVGNNVDAYADLVAPDGFGAGDVRASTTSAGTFDRTYDTTLDPAANPNQTMAAVTQLFFDVNFFHDWFYDAGFDEAAGNAQEDNYSRGGLPGDRLHAEGQDVGGTNNANMSTPSDGESPRMQMYVWTPRSVHTVTVTPPGANYSNGMAQFGPPGFDVTGSVVLAADGVGTTTDACEPITNGVAGKIVLVDRGTCSFELKVVNAQNAGAIGVIVANNVSGAPNMTNDTAVPGPVTIGVLSISQSDGTSVKNALISGPVSARLFRDGLPTRDGDIDNTVVAHEWGHYISNRLVADANGLGNLQGGGMGEGWADFHALLMIVRPEDTAVPSNATFNGVYGVAGYAVGGRTAAGAGNDSYYFGLRRYPYSTDMAKNPLTFRHISTGVPLPVGPPVNGGGNNAEVHNTGEVWATMLWECYASILRDTLGPSPRLSFAEAQKRMRDYLVAGYKLTPADPTFVEAKNALLAAIAAGDQNDYSVCAQAFARRGNGVGAIAPDRYSNNNAPLTESFATGNDLEFVSATLGDGASSCDADGVLDAAESAALTITLRNIGTGLLSATTATVGSANPEVSFPAGTVVAFPPTQPFQTTTASIPVHLGLLTGIQQVALSIAYRDPALTNPGDRFAAGTYRVNTDELPATSKADDIESDSTTWSVGGTPGFSAVAGWRRVEITPLDHRWLGPDAPSGPTDQVVMTPPLQVSASGSFGFTFRQRYQFENDAVPTYYDGGVVELSTDGGTIWTDIGASASPGYNGTISTCCENPLGTRPAYVKNNAGYPAFETVSVNLGTAYQGAAVRIRFRVATDQAVGGNGWEVDDVAFTGIDNKPFAALVADGGSCLHPGDVELHVSRNGHNPNLVDFSWGASCGNDVGSYAVYDGELGSYYGEIPISCNVSGTTLSGQETGSGSRYFLVAPVSALSAEEGSHGSGLGGPRPPSPSACNPALDSQACN